MADGMTKPIIFISYSHLDEPKNPGPKDERWLTFVQSHLQPAVKHGIYDLWVDEDIPGGGAWRAEITKKLNECDVCVLLVSRHSLASDFIIDVEIDTLRKRRKKGEADIFPIVLTPCAVKTAPWIKEINLRPSNGQPLSDFEENERHKQMATIAGEIAELAEGIAQRKAAVVGFGEAVPRFDNAGVKFDVSRLPETAYERLVGRDDELKRLDGVWADPNTNIISLIAEGGAGKSALVNEWLERLQADNYRGAEAVLGWSFYSQGSKERATAADEFFNWVLDRLSIKLDTTSPTARGEAVAEALIRHRVLLVLDGVEPLQHGLDAQLGQLKDQGLRALLRRFAATPPARAHGLIVLTSRLAVRDIARWHNNATPVLDIGKLSDEAGAALLRDNGVWGTDKQLREAARDFGGHPLALGLLATFLKETQSGDLRRRDHIRELLADTDNPGHDHARRVMESYEKEWLAGQPILLAIMHMVGLFDRPASRKCLFALRRMPAIKGLTESIVNLDDRKWRRAITRLVEARLLSPTGISEPDELDAHPLVREWFGERLRQTNKTAWSDAHSRLYEHLRDTTKEGKTPTLESLAPLYQAIAHGCRAERHRQVLKEVYEARICRNTNGSPVFYASTRLCAFSTNLAAISWFFEIPYSVPEATFLPGDKAWILNEAGSCLAAEGRFSEAIAPLNAAMAIFETRELQPHCVIAASNLCEFELEVGDIANALRAAQQINNYSQTQGPSHFGIAPLTIVAAALRASGRENDAAVQFAEADELQKASGPQFPILYSLQGYYYCDFLLGKSEYPEAIDRSTITLKWSKAHNFPRDVALSELVLARGRLGSAIQSLRAGKAPPPLSDVLQLFNRSIEGCRNAGEVRFLARSLLSRSVLHRSIANWINAGHDLNEVEEIAEFGPMRLHLCDMALGRARLAFAQIEAFAPLKGMLEKDNPPNPAVPSAEEIAALLREAEKQLKVAGDYIKTCGYHLRDEELAELQAVLRGQKKFAELPPRV